MARVHLYFGIENLALNAQRRSQLIAMLDALGPDSDDQPARLNQRRVRLDNQAAIYEAAFQDFDVTPAAFAMRLAELFNVNPANVTIRVNRVVFYSWRSAVLTFGYAGTDYLRVVFFGYNGRRWPSWKESRLETVAYLQAHREAWEGPSDA